MVNLEDTIPFTNITLMQLIVAIVILIVGWIAIRIAKGLLGRSLTRSKIPPLVVELMTRLLGVLLWVAVILFAVGALGFDSTAVVLGLSAVIGLILAWGMRDTLENFFSGVWLAVVRPFDKGDYIEVQGQSGTVQAVGIMSTEMIGPDNRFIIIANKNVWGSTMVNYSRMPIRRAEIIIGTSYSGDVGRAMEISMNFIKSHPLVLEDPAPAVVITELGDSSVNLSLRAWAKKEDFWTMKWDLTKGIFEEFNRQGIEIPFPQMDVHFDRTE